MELEGGRTQFGTTGGRRVVRGWAGSDEIVGSKCSTRFLVKSSQVKSRQVKLGPLV